MSSPRQNQLLAALPENVFEHFSAHLEKVELPTGTVLYQCGDDLRYAYFPTTCIISKLYVMENGATAEIAVVGNDGMVGVALFMGGKSMPNRAEVQCGGEAYRIPAQRFLIELNRSGGRRQGALNKLLLSYTQALFTQMAQTAVCNRHHSIDQQLCRGTMPSPRASSPPSRAR